MKKLTTTSLLALLSAAAGCADPTTGDPMTDPDPDDITAPVIASTEPAAQATAVASGTKIIVTFSESMDPATVEAAYSSADLPLSAVSLSWNDDNTILTISPDAGLEYAEGIGTDPSMVPAKGYSISIGATATDYAGNPLAAPLALSFSTKRRMAASFAFVPNLTRATVGDSLLATFTDLWVGDSAAATPYRSYVTFSLASMPEGVELESAEFSARQLAAQGAPYNLGAVVAHHVNFPNVFVLTGMPAISIPGTYSQDAVSESKVIDVTAQVADDLANRAARGNRTQYRLQIDQATNNDPNVDKAVFAKDTLSLSTVYVAN